MSKWFSQIVLDLVRSQTNKIDSASVSGLSGVADSLAYKVHEIEKHVHNTEYIYGNSSNAMAKDIPIAFTIEGGDNAWGTELLLTDGTVIESGSTTKKFDLNTIYITAVDAANAPTVVNFKFSSKGTPLTSVAIDETGGAMEDMFTKAGHGLVNTDKVILSSIVTTTGINAYTVYYVVNMSGDNFQLSLTSGGSAVAVTNDGTCTVTKLTETNETSTFVSMAATSNDSAPYPIICPRVTCNNTISVRAKSETGETLGISFVIGLHIYTA